MPVTRPIAFCKSVKVRIFKLRLPPAPTQLNIVLGVLLIKVDPLTVKSFIFNIAPPSGALLLINLEPEIVTLGLPFKVLISIAPPSTSAELLMNFELVILMVPAQISIAPPY